MKNMMIHVPEYDHRYRLCLGFSLNDILNQFGLVILLLTVLLVIDFDRGFKLIIKRIYQVKLSKRSSIV